VAISADPALRAALGRERIASELAALEIASAPALLVHCSMRRIGWIEGGSATLAAALLDVLGPQATLVVPTQTADNSTTTRAFRAATRGMSPAQVAQMEARIPAFDRACSPSHGMGSLAEHIRRHPGSVRSDHPQVSFAALGPKSDKLMQVHDLDCHLGERSPLGSLYTADAQVLLLGVGYEACTALHLAEYRLPWALASQTYRCYRMESARRVLTEFVAARLDDTDFHLLGRELDMKPFARRGRVGYAQARALRMRDAVDFAVVWLTTHRTR
jgi:aminoglycoside 3-N-acetyltransferase